MSNAPAPAPTPAPSPAHGVTLEQVDGGPGWYGKLSNPLPTSPDHFPIGVWGAYNQTQENRDRDAAVGINTYVWAADEAFMDEIRADGRFRVIQDRSIRSNLGPETAGWVLADEIDMTDGPAACNGRLQQIKNGLPQDGRLRYVNYGKGVLLWETAAEARCFVEAVDLVSTDLYWFTDPNQVNMIGTPWLPEGPDRRLTLSELRRAANYGYQVDWVRSLDAMDGQRKPIWNFVEVGNPWDDTGRQILPAEIRAAVWHSLIAGARGIIYFQHSFGGPCPAHHALRDPDPCYADVQAMVAAVNDQIKALAPVLNAPTVTSGTSTSSSIRSMTKWHNGHFYVFAGSRENQSSIGTLSLACLGDARAVRLGEAGIVPVSRGSFSDSFADGNAIHIYRIDGGATCQLPTGTAQPAPGRGGPGRRGRMTSRVGRLPRRVSLRSGRLVVPIVCANACLVRSRLTMRGASGRIKLAARQRRFRAGRHKLFLRLSRRARHRVDRARRQFSVRLDTVIIERRGGRARRTQRLVAERR